MGSCGHFNSWTISFVKLYHQLSLVQEKVYNDDFQSLVLAQAKTIANDHIKALQIMNTPLVPLSMPISVQKSIVVPSPPFITQGPLTTPPNITQGPLTTPPVITQALIEPSPVTTQDFDDDYSFVDPYKPTSIIVRIKDPRSPKTIVHIKDPRPKLTYHNPHAQLHSFTIPTPKQTDTPIFSCNL